MTAKLFFQGYYIELFLEIYSRPTNDHQKRLTICSKQFSSQCQSLK